MASQIAHIVYAKRFFDSLEDSEHIRILNVSRNLSVPEKLDRDRFLLGTVFPDIRRIDRNVSRKDTHLRFDPLDLDFSGLESFEAGWKFHLFCDMRREEILKEKEFYAISGAGDFYSTSNKLLEDELIYGDYDNWEKVVAYFRNPPLVESGIGVSRETFSLWYAILAKYFEKNPTIKEIRAFAGKLAGMPGTPEEIASSISKLKKNRKAVDILLGIKEEII